MKMTLIWKHPFTCVVAGPSQCGKTSFILEFLRHANEVIVPAPEHIIWHYGTYQSIFNSLQNVEFIEGIPNVNNLRKNSLIILDDLMQEADDRVTKIFTKFSHHNDISVLFLTQNLFFKNLRTLTLNAHYLVLFKSPRDASQITFLARQMYPGKSKYLLDAFTDATAEPYSYLVIDLTATTSDQHRLRSGIFPNQAHHVYIPK
jgi:hypothetical protein